MRALRFALALLVVSCASATLSLAAGCASAPATRKQPAELRTVVEPETARVQVDERFVGAARVLARHPARLTPGTHRITVEAPGHFPHDMQLELPPGETKLELQLRPIPP